MRVTNQGMLNNYLNNLNRNLTQMSKYQNQLSSGKEMSRPSDDPFAVTKAMSLTTTIHQNQQYLRNIEDSMGWVDMTDSTLGNLGDVLNRIRELVVQGANGPLSDTDRGAVQDEVEQLVDQIAQIGNSNYDGRYIFGGQATTQPPFKVGEYGLEYNGANEDQNQMLVREISPNVTMEINVPGNWIIQGRNQEIPIDLPTTLNSIVDALEMGDTKRLGGELLQQLDKHMDNILSIRSEMGAKYNRLEAAQSKNQYETLNMTKLLSKTEDIDFAEKIMQYMNMQSVYMASLATGAKILQPTLLDFLG
ncbi:flagellar hook-associated protein FlgL [Garciella nitratireducens]|uniref:flagellar hook-associated protein FlgL n=1 Tax=Garciella nitratireducens TaxID=218205 RepID=UPI000DE82CB5|nr:flagellar hook-associated protein FlgL [Garciella nitratireducens]RBP46778.1 flagellar hook-associated protein 3 FlgL [Garciella nitratireducens]